MSPSKSKKNKSGAVTIFDVAEKAGVSISTVSLALKGSGPVSKPTLAAVHKAAKALGYQPNLAAQSLARRQTNLIAVCGWFAPDNLASSSNSSNQMLMGVMERLKGTRYASYLVNWSTHPGEHLRLIKNFSEQGFICGFIWFSSSLDREERQQLRRSRVPVVLVEAKQPRIDSVVVDNELGAYLGAAQLLKKSRRLVLITADPEGLVQKERIGGVRRALAEARMPWSAVKIFHANHYSFNNGVDLAPKIAALAKKGERLAVFSLAGDKTALGLMHGLKAEGIKVPAQVSVLGWDGILEGGYFSPSLSSVEQPLTDMGFKAADALIQRLELPNPPVQSIQLQPRLILRESA